MSNLLDAQNPLPTPVEPPPDAFQAPDASQVPPPRARLPGWAGPVAVVSYVGLSIFGIIGVGLLVALAMVASAAFGGDLSAVMAGEPMSGGVMALATVVQFGMMFALAALLGLALRRRLSETFAIRWPHATAVVAAVLGGLVVGVFPGWIAEQLASYVPSIDSGNLQMINELIASGSLSSRIGMWLVVCVGAPVVEELVFRGFMWDALALRLPRGAVWVGTSLLFAAYHMDPIHVMAVVFTGLFLGWLRNVSGSIVPGMIAHGVNNALAAAAATWVGAEAATDLHTPWWAALLAAGATIGLAAFATIGAPSSSPNDSDAPPAPDALPA